MSQVIVSSISFESVRATFIVQFGIYTGRCVFQKAQIAFAQILTLFEKHTYKYKLIPHSWPITKYYQW